MNTDFSQALLKKKLSENKINESISLLKEAVLANIAVSPRTSRLLAELEVQEQTYRHMSEWLFSGYPDPEREDVYQKIVESLTQIGEELAFLLTINELGVYYAERRSEKISPVSLKDLVESYLDVSSKLEKADEAQIPMPQLKARKEEKLSKIFRKTWIMGFNEKEDLEFISTLFEEDHDYELMCMIVGGLTMGVLQYYDRSKLEALMRYYEILCSRDGDERVQARLLVGIVLVMHRWREEIRNDIRLKLRFGLWNDSIVNHVRLNDVILTLIKTKDTDRVAKKIKEDLLPALMKTSPEIMRKLKEGNGVLDMSEFEENPEWEKFLKESGLQSKLMELNEMQMAGMDVMMQAFAQLKSFPFFHDAANWFLPFSEDHSAVSRFKAYSNESLRRVLGDEMGFCEGDKYSFVLSLISMPSERAMAISAQMEAGFEQMKEELKSEMLRRKKSEFTTEIVKYARDLYRFFRLYPRRRDYPKVFAEAIDFRTIPFIGEMMTGKKMLESVGQFYFSAGYYSEALSMFENLALLEHKDRPLLEKIGYCYQVGGDYKSALENYEKADLFSSDSEPTSMWLLKKMALCNKVLGNNEAATELYKQAVERDPEDVRMRLNLGHLLLNMGRTEDALKEYYTADYHNPGNKSTKRSIVRGEMKAGNLEKARRNLDRLLEGEFTPYDRQLGGHLAYLEGNLREALPHYRASKEENVTEDELRTTLAKEMEFLQGDRFDSLAFGILLDEMLK